MLPQQYCLRWKYHHSNLQTMFSQLLDRGCFCDVTLACEGQLIRAHRVVLCACSTFFDTVLTNYASERDPIIIMKDVTFADVKSLIEFMYKGEINVEHANLASLLKTADELKIKGLAEVSWRDDEDNGSIGGSVIPPPVPDTEFIVHSPPLLSSHRTHDNYSNGLDARCSPIGDIDRRNSSPTHSSKQQQQLPSRLPMLTPIPSQSITIAAATGEHYLGGQKRKRGRPPLDDAYDVFNVHKLSQLGGHLDSQRYLEESRIQSSKNDDQRRHLSSAYQQHIHQQQRRQRQKFDQHHGTDSEDADDTQTDPEWINSNLEVNVGECDVETIGPMENSDDSQSAEQNEKKMEKEKTVKSPTGAKEKISEEKLNIEKGTSKMERFRKRSPLEKAKEHRQRENNEKQSTKTINNNDNDDLEKRQKSSDAEEDEEPAVLPQPVEEIESVQQVLKQQQQQQQDVNSASITVTTTTTTPAKIASPSNLPSTSSTSSSHSDSQTKTSTHTSSHSNNAHAPHAAHSHGHIPPPPAAHTHFTKYAPPEGAGYVLNDHGILMTHDFQSHPVLGVPNGNGDSDFIDIKMEDYDAADLRLTSEEMSQWQDVIKMDDYLAKGRRPQFWEEPFTRRVLDAIKNKRLEMKKAARILGVSYGTLYGRYREVYGCLKHPYSSTFRPPQSSQLAAVQPRFDIVWPSPKREASMLAAPLEIGKIRPKDLSELWARPQI